MQGPSEFFDVPHMRRDLTRAAIERIYEVTGCKVSWRTRPNRGHGKKLGATGPMHKCQEAVMIAFLHMQAVEEPVLPAAIASSVQQKQEEARVRRAAHSGHWRFQEPAVLSSQTFFFVGRGSLS